MILQGCKWGTIDNKYYKSIKTKGEVWSKYITNRLAKQAVVALKN